MTEFDPLFGDLSELDARTLLVSASAGTGKTWMITHLATRWLLDDATHDPAQLLMVTFSRAAAAEMKARLRARVVEVGRVLDGTREPKDEWVASLIDEEVTSPRERASLLARQREVLSRLDDVNARTIHSFAALVRDQTARSVDSGTRLYERAVNEALTRLALNEPDALRTLIADPLNKGEGDGASKASTLATKVLKTLNATVGLGGLGPNPAGESKALAWIPEMASDEEIPDEAHRSAVARAKVFYDLVIDAERRGSQIQALERCSTFNSLIAEVYWEVVRGGQEAIARLRSSFGFVLIDEFQDTDSAQFEIFSSVFIDHAPVVIVGDPKQAIYGFRGGDVVIFQDLLNRAEMPGSRLLRHDLEKNYRSTAALLGHLNALFDVAELDSIRLYWESIEAGAFQGLARRWEFSTPLSADDSRLAPIRYRPVTAAVPDAAENPGRGAPFVVRDLTQERPLARCHPSTSERPVAPGYPFAGTLARSNETIRREIFADVITVVKARMNEPWPDGTQVGWDDIVILCRTNPFASGLCRHLRDVGIPAITTKTEPVFDAEAATHLRSLLFCLVDPTNPRRSGLLRYTWFAHHDPDELLILAQVLEDFGPGALARRALGTTTMATILRSEAPERNWTDVDHLFELLARAFPFGVEGVIALRWLDEAIAESKAAGDDDAVTRKIETDGGSVTVMTLHSAKGLEYPIVLIPQIETPARPQAVPAISTPEGRKFDLMRSTSSDDDTTTVSPAVDEMLQQTDEAARLIYVGLTRAKSELVVWISDLDRHEYSKTSRASTRVAKTSLWRALLESLSLAEPDELATRAAEHEALGARFDPSIEITRPTDQAVRGPRSDIGSSDGPSLGIEIDLENVVEPPAIDEDLRRWSYSALHVHGTEADEGQVDSDGEDAGFDRGAMAEDIAGSEIAASTIGAELFEGRSGTQVGVAIHEVLERVVGVRQAQDSEALRAAIFGGFRAAGVAVADIASMEGQFRSILTHPLGELLDDATLDSFARAGSVRTANEMRFTLPLIGDDRAERVRGSQRAKKGDRLIEIAELVARRDPTGPYRSYFSQLAESPKHPARLLEGFLTGSIDLVAQLGEETPRFVVIDYKSNLLRQASSYAPGGLIGEMALSGYPLQGLLYSVALHRYLAKRLSRYDPAVNLGGICYFYVRGAALPQAKADDGVASWRIPANVVVGVSDLLQGIELRP